MPKWAIRSAKTFCHGSAQTPPGSTRIQRTSAKMIFRRSLHGELAERFTQKNVCRRKLILNHCPFAGRSAESAGNNFWRKFSGSAWNRADSAANPRRKFFRRANSLLEHVKTTVYSLSPHLNFLFELTSILPYVSGPFHLCVTDTCNITSLHVYDILNFVLMMKYDA